MGFIKQAVEIYRLQLELTAEYWYWFILVPILFMLIAFFMDRR